MKERLLTVKEVAEYLGFTEYAVRKWLREGNLKGIKIGDFWRVRQEDLEAFLEQEETP